MRACNNSTQCIAKSILTSLPERKRGEWDTELMCEDNISLVIYGLIVSCKKWNEVCAVVTGSLYAHSSVISVFISIVAFQFRK